MNPSTDRFQGTSQGSHHWRTCRPQGSWRQSCEILGLLPQQPLQPCLYRGPHSPREVGSWMERGSHSSTPTTSLGGDGLRCPVLVYSFCGLVRAAAQFSRHRGSAPVWVFSPGARDPGTDETRSLVQSVLPAFCGGWFHIGTPSPYSQMLRLCVVTAVFSVLLCCLFTSVLALHCCTGSTHRLPSQRLRCRGFSCGRRRGLRGTAGFR